MAVSKRLRYEILRRDNHTCRYCGAAAPDVKLTVDHVVPTALGGTDEPTNLAAACEACNTGKSASSPDAPIVEDVAQDAVRWSKAMTTAAQSMIEELDYRDSYRAYFDEIWCGWSYGPAENRQKIPRPDSWKSSVDGFMAAGLPAIVLEDCIELAMMANHVSPDGTFRYMCGIAWNRVAQLQERARDVVETIEPAPTPKPAPAPLPVADPETVKAGVDACREALRKARRNGT